MTKITYVIHVAKANTRSVTYGLGHLGKKCHERPLSDSILIMRMLSIGAPYGSASRGNYLAPFPDQTTGDYQITDTIILAFPYETL